LPAEGIYATSSRVPITPVRPPHGPSGPHLRAKTPEGEVESDFVSLEVVLPISALLLIVVAAFANSTWNLLAKRASHTTHFIWFSSLSEVILLLPLAIWTLADSWSQLSWKVMIFLFATGILDLLYTECLLRGYRVGDLSVVYPLARGTEPLLSFFGAILVLGERPSSVTGTGALLVTSGILIVSGGAPIQRSRWIGPCWGLATGLTIACYTLVDGYSVKRLLLSPILLEYAGNLFRTIVLSGGAWRAPTSLPTEYRLCWREALGVAILTPVGYVLVLFAMRMAPVSHVAPAREMSMMIGPYLGSRFLSEGHLARRLAGSLLIAAGIAALALG
jgi:drug/metabolite transporter (DMT)-like permease